MLADLNMKNTIWRQIYGLIAAGNLLILWLYRTILCCVLKKNTKYSVNCKK